MAFNKEKILFVDDEKQILISLKALFRSKYQVLVANSGEEALKILAEDKTIRALISDQRMPKMLGAEVLREARKISPSTMRLLLTGYSDLQSIISSINDGEVFRFINKPWDNHELRAIIDLAVTTALETEQVANIEEQAQFDVLEAESAIEIPVEKPAIITDATAASDAVPLDKPAILVLDDDPEILTTVTWLFQNKAPVIGANTIDDAIEALGEREIAVIVSEVSVGGEDATELVKLLKQKYPAIMTIMLTRFHGADIAISLINQGQIYRYLNKPIHESQLQRGISSALTRYSVTMQRPELLKRHKVQEMKQTRNPSLAEKLVNRLQSFRKRFSFGF